MLKIKRITFLGGKKKGSEESNQSEGKKSNLLYKLVSLWLLLDDSKFLDASNRIASI